MKTTLNFKKLALLLLLTATIGQMQAQDDVYTAGYYTNTNGKTVAAVYKNGTLLYHFPTAPSSNNYKATAVTIDPDTKDVYWAYTYDDDLYSFSDIYKNGTKYLNNTTGTWIHKLYFSDGHLYALGSVYDFGWHVAYWKDNNSNPIYQTPVVGYMDPPVDTDFCINNGDVYFYEHEGTTVKKNGVELYSYPNCDNLVSVDFYEGHLYVAGYERYIQNNHYVYENKIYKDGTLLYTLPTESSPRINGFFIEGGYLYAMLYSGQVEFMNFLVYVYKPEVQIFNFSNSPVHSYDSNSHGLYTAHYATVDKNCSEILTIQDPVSTNGESTYRIESMKVDPQCEEDDIRELPFIEDFDGLNSGWECWTKYDVDGNNAGNASYWYRFGKGLKASNDPSPFSGDNCAKHKYSGSTMQNGVLVSPRLFLQPNRSSTTLSFWTYEQYPNDCQYEGVLISTSSNSLSSFTEIWTQTNASATWKHVTLDLSAYQGEAVYIAFKYSGQNGHNWYIDDVEVTENESQCYTEGYLPYTQTFDYEMGICWYVIDADMSGGKKCWKWNSSDQSVMHPYGQSGVPQEGWLISRPISIWQEDYGYTLSFKSKSTSSGTGRRNSVWISVDQSASNPPDPADFTEIWVDPSYSSSWTEYEIDLSEYAGHNVNIAFKYEGTWAHNWSIDDFSVSAFPLYWINATANPSNGGMVSGSGYYMPGATCTLTATAEYGYSFVNWTKNGTEVSTTATYTFTVNDHGNYVANFTPNEYTVEVVANPTSGGTVTGGGTFALGDDCTLTATANPGYNFVNWTLNGEVVFNNSTYIFTVTEDGTYVANFEQTGGSTTQTSNFVSGWNWWSSYIELDGNSLNTLEDGLGTNGVTIKSQNDGYNSYLEGLGWYGSLASINNESCYQVKASAPCSVSMTGNVANPTSHPITLNANGWTWIGYPLSNSSSISSALSGFAPQPNDMLKSQNDGYASYLEGYGWYGALSTLNPGMGLMYKSFNSETVTFTYHIGGLKGELKPNQTTDNNHWVPNLTAYADNMSVMAVIELDGVELRGENYELAAFANGECRGSARLIYVAPLDRYIAFLTIAGDEASKLHFGLYNAKTGEECFNSLNVLTFVPNAVHGSFDSLYVVGFRNTTGVDTHEAALRLYPNPAKSVIRIEGLEAGSEVRIYNSLGVLVKTLNVTADREISIGDLAKGIYLLRCQNTSLRFVKD